MNHKLEHYGVRGHAIKSFKSYLSERKQYTAVNNADFQTNEISYGVPQGSVLGPLLFLIYINNLNSAITFSYIQHFADDTNILYKNHSLKKINQRISFDLKNIVEWLRANRTALNTSKTEIVLFRTLQKPITRKMNFRISSQKIKPKSSAKYLGLIIDEFLNWKTHYTILRRGVMFHQISLEQFTMQFLTHTLGMDVKFGAKTKILAQMKFLH